MGSQKRHVREMSVSLHLLARSAGGIKCHKTHIQGSIHLHLVHEPPRCDGQQAILMKTMRPGLGRRPGQDDRRRPPSTQHNQASELSQPCRQLSHRPAPRKDPLNLSSSPWARPRREARKLIARPNREPEPEAPSLKLPGPPDHCATPLHSTDPRTHPHPHLKLL